MKEVTGADAAFVVTLDAKEGRRRMDRMRKSIVGPHITKIDGIHGKALAPEEYAGVVERNRRSMPLSPGEVGCILGHRKAWQAIVDSGVETAMVLEDDASAFASDFVQKVALILQHTPSDWGILLIGFWLRNHASGATDNDVAVNAYVQRVFDFVLMDCYLVTRATAQALLRSRPSTRRWTAGSAGRADPYPSTATRSSSDRHTNRLPRKALRLHQSSWAAGSAGGNQRDRPAHE